eukprot:10052771-Ditylum_brightwellii.AAC.1
MNIAKERIKEEVDLDTDTSCYGIDRSFWRGSETQAGMQGVDEVDIQEVNRWRYVEILKGARPSFNMVDHYSDTVLMLPVLLRYSSAL